MAGQNRTLLLPDGRELGFTEYGNPEGTPLVYNHGFTSSHREWETLADPVASAGLDVRVIAVDRPGIGNSTHDPDRTIGSWAKDVAALADSLAIDRFAVMGVSGGGPYALSVAAGLGDRISRCGVVVGMGPLEAGIRGFSMIMPAVHRRVRSAFFEFAAFGVNRRPASYVKNMRRVVSTPDRDAMRVERVRSGFLHAAVGGFAQGSVGAATDGELYGRPWDFDLGAIVADTYLWYGERDVVVVPGVGDYLQRKMPNSHLETWSDEGHVSWMVDRGTDVVRTLVA